MLEQRIICKLVPKSVDDISLTENSDKIEQMPSTNTQMKDEKLKEVKRVKLNELLRDYQDKLLGLEIQYRQALVTFDNDHVRTSSSSGNHSSSIQLMKKYVCHRFSQFKRENRFKMTLFREKLYRRRKHQLKSKGKHKIDVYPQTIIDVSTIPLNETELVYLSSAGSTHSSSLTSSIFGIFLFFLSQSYG